MAVVAAAALVLDQLTKLAVLSYLGPDQEKVIIDGFFKFVHWGNTGAAWSLFNQFAGSNQLLAVFALVALLVLFFTRHHFDSHTLPGQLSLGLIFGGIAGNLVDRFTHKHVVDVLYFYLVQRGGREICSPGKRTRPALLPPRNRPDKADFFGRRPGQAYGKPSFTRGALLASCSPPR